MQLSRDREGRVGTPVGSLEEITSTFKWGDLSQICYRDHIHQAGFGETNEGGEPKPARRRKEVNRAQ